LRKLLQSNINTNFINSNLCKFFFRLLNGYKNLMGIDSAFVLITLTGGIVLRLNPNFLKDRQTILYYLHELKVMIERPFKENFSN
jgi:hypothetical protein